MTDKLFLPVDILSLVAFRWIFGGCMLFENARYYFLGYQHNFLVAPSFHPKFYGFTWVRELPAAGMELVFIGLMLASAGVMLGAWYRASAIVLFFTFTYTFLLDAATYRNHFYLLSLLSLLMIFLPAHRAWSIDAARKPKVKSTTTPRVYVWLLQFQLGVVYFFAGIAKLDPDWLSGSSFIAVVDTGGHTDSVSAVLKSDFLISFFTWSGLLFDLAIPFLLLWKRTRVVAFVAAAGFHLSNGLFLVSVGIFPWFMLLASTIFFSPEWPRALIRRIDSSLQLPPIASPHPDSVPGRRLRWWIVSALTAYMLVQLFLPLRQHLYPGKTSWTHEGHRWAWRMKLVQKQITSVKIFSFDPDTGNRIDLTSNLDLALHPWQKQRVCWQPDLLLQFVHDLDRQLQKKLGKDFPIHADIRISLNQRLSQPLVDKSIDLSKESWTIRPARWIVPLEQN